MVVPVKKKALTLASLGLAATVGYFAHEAQILNPAHANTPPAVATQPVAVPVEPAAPSMVGGLPNFSGIVSTYGPSVVSITVSGTQKTAFGSEDDPRLEFFRRFGIPVPQQKDAPVRGQGSGFVISADGLILTNAHVVENANRVTVKLSDRREVDAKVIGTDKVSDVAVLKVEASNLKPVRLGDPSKTRVGEWVVAIGAPFGLENSASAGIVSATSRSLPDEGYVPFIQTDAAVNPGNSGGPLFNAAGEVVGINSQIYSRTGGYQGLSFAIPIDVAVKVKDQLVATGKVQRGKLGIGIQELNQALADSFGLGTPQGALVSSVEKDGPAAKAGLQSGDVILKVDGQAIQRSSDLPPRIADVRPGTETHLEIWRKGENREVRVKVGELSPAKTAGVAPSKTDQGKLGLAVRPLNADERGEIGAEGGVLVENVADGSPAARAGVQSGDVIVSFNNRPISSTEQLRDLVKQAGKHAALLIQRDGNRIFVPVDLG